MMLVDSLAGSSKGELVIAGSSGSLTVVSEYGITRG